MNGSKFSLREALSRGPVAGRILQNLLPGLPICFSLSGAHLPGTWQQEVTIVGISQNQAKDTAAFVKEYGITFPVLLDDTDTFPVSNAYGLTNVPTHLLDRARMAKLKSPAWAGRGTISKRSIAKPPKPMVRHRCRFSSRTNLCPNSAPVEARKTSPQVAGFPISGNSPHLRLRRSVACHRDKLSFVLFAIFLSSRHGLTPAKPARRAPTVRLPGSAISAMQKINPERIRAHVRFLSHDLLEGRGTGQRGGDIAAEYIATEFALYGLKPAGDNGTYMQKVPLVGVTTSPRPNFLSSPTTGRRRN